jgi:hypothetical protein
VCPSGLCCGASNTCGKTSTFCASGSCQPAYGSCTTTVCGNGVCESPWLLDGETCGNCPVDCNPCQLYNELFECPENGLTALTIEDGPKVCCACMYLTNAWCSLSTHLNTHRSQSWPVHDAVVLCVPLLCSPPFLCLPDVQLLCKQHLPMYVFADWTDGLCVVNADRQGGQHFKLLLCIHVC